MIDHTVGRALDLFDIDVGLVKRWREDSAPKKATRKARAPRRSD